MLAQALYATLPIIVAVAQQRPYPIQGLGGYWPWFFIHLAIQHVWWIGVVIGFLAGSMTGPTLSAVASRKTEWLSRNSPFPRVAGVIAAMIGVIVASSMRVALMQYAHYPWFGMTEFVAALLLPGLAGLWVGRRLADWLIAEQIGREA
jgi:hypothetical protein